MCQVVIPLLVGAQCCVYLRLVKGMFMSTMFVYYIGRGRSVVVTNCTPFLI
jgi:hypothetical protein